MYTSQPKIQERHLKFGGKLFGLFKISSKWQHIIYLTLDDVEKNEAKSDLVTA